MSARERILSLVAVVALFVFVGGFLGYQFFLRPMKVVDNRIATLQDETATDELELAKAEKDIPRLRVAKLMSLPANPTSASSLYGDELEKMLRESKFAAGKFSVGRKESELRTASSATTTKKQTTQKLLYDVQAHGELSSFVAFLDRFYSTPLLHRIRTIRIERPYTSTGNQARTELDITLSIEALILDGAEDRKTLLPTFPPGLEPPKIAARSSAQYASIGGRDIFFGPPPPKTGFTGIEKDPTTQVELAECIHIDEITIGAVTEVSMYDALNNRRYRIRREPNGSFKVYTYYYNNKGEKKFLDSDTKLNILGDDGEPVMTYEVVRIDATQLVLASDSAYFTLHAGGRIKDVKSTTAKALGLPVKDEKKDKPAEKKDVKPAMIDGPQPPVKEEKASLIKDEADGK